MARIVRDIAAIINTLPDGLLAGTTLAQGISNLSFDPTDLTEVGFMRVLEPLTVLNFPALRIDPEPDGITQFIHYERGRMVLSTDDPAASRWLVQYLTDVQTRFVVNRQLEEEDSGPSVLIRPIRNNQRRTCAYYIVPVIFKAWNYDPAIFVDLDPPAEDDLSVPGDLSNPEAFVAHFRDDEGRFFLPNELASYDADELITFWKLCSMAFDRRIDIAVILDLPFFEHRREGLEAQRREIIAPPAVVAPPRPGPRAPAPLRVEAALEPIREEPLPRPLAPVVVLTDSSDSADSTLVVGLVSSLLVFMGFLAIVSRV